MLPLATLISNRTLWNDRGFHSGEVRFDRVTTEPLGICIVFQSSPHCNTADKGHPKQIIAFWKPVRPLSAPLPFAGVQPTALEFASSYVPAQNNNIDSATSESIYRPVPANLAAQRDRPLRAGAYREIPHNFAHPIHNYPELLRYPG